MKIQKSFVRYTRFQNRFFVTLYNFFCEKSFIQRALKIILLTFLNYKLPYIHICQMYNFLLKKY